MLNHKEQDEQAGGQIIQHSRWNRWCMAANSFNCLRQLVQQSVTKLSHPL